MSDLGERISEINLNGGQEEEPFDVEAFKAKASAHGWAKPVSYDYDAFTAKVGAPQAGEGEEGVGDSHDIVISGGMLWASSARKYEWNEEYGDVGPEIPELEKELFAPEFRVKPGEWLETMLKYKVFFETQAKIEPIVAFADAGLHPVLMRNLKLCGYTIPTPVQCYTIPSILTNRDIIAVAQTGSGKTAAFLIPIISKLMGKAKKIAAPRPPPVDGPGFDWKRYGVVAEPLVLVVVPTRELAIQIFDDARRLCYRSMLRPCVAYGGGPTRDQADELRRGCDILIGTPGRLKDFLSRGNVVSLKRVRYTVIDEADELVDIDWDEDMKMLLSGGDNNEDADHRYMLFSATFNKQARLLARDYLEDDHVRISVGRVGQSHSNIYQRVVDCAEMNKLGCLRDLLMNCPPARTIIFVNRKEQADLVDDYLYNHALPSTSIHSGRNQREREDALRAFKLGKAPILVATGVSARGLDIANVMHVINFDLPTMDHGGINEYVHRIGRTARIGNKGNATSFFDCDRDEGIAYLLVKTLIENNNPVPEFLDQYKPAEGEEGDFDDESDDENAAADDGDAGWGAGGDAGADAGGWGAGGNTGGDTWGAGGGASGGDDGWANTNGAAATHKEELPRVQPTAAAW